MVREDNKYSIFIPCFELDKKRKRNLEFTYNRLSERGLHTVLAVQGDYDEYYNKFNNTEVKFFSKEGVFNKSFILNRCLELVKTNFFVFLDIDVYFSFDSINDINADDEIVKPFKECTYLTEELTQEFIDKRSIKIPINAKKVSALGGGSLIIRSDLIKSKSLRFDEKFTGWGWEDIDFGDQIRSKGLKVRTIEQPAIHLYHEPSQSNEYNNSLHYKSKNKIKSKIVHIFSSDNSDLSSINSFVANKTSDVLLINCAKVDQINNPNVKFIYSNRMDSAYLTELAGEFVDNQGWIVCTQGSFVADDRFYLEINNKTEDYHTLGQAEGFILKQNFFQEETGNIKLNSKKNENEKTGIYLKVENGLANRLRCLSSFYNFAIKYNKNLFVCWEKGPGWGDESFLELFENIEGINFISNDNYQEYSCKYDNLDRLIEQSPPIYYVFKKPGGAIVDLIKNKSFCYNGQSALEYFTPCDLETNNLFFDKLVPKNKINNKIKRIISVFDENTIGVHIRRGDALNSPWKIFYDLSNDDFFIKEIVKEIDKNPKANFYLSTDCEQTQKRFLEIFQNRIIALDKVFVDSTDMFNPKFGQESAVIDLFCLSNTNKIIGTYWSSFSTLAANLKNKPIYLASNHVEASKTYLNSSKQKEITTIVCATKNRLNSLILSLTSWLMIPQIDNIIIVDYSSADAVEPKIKNLSDKISVIRIENEEFFNISKAYNIGFKAAPDGLILKMDVDYILSPYLNFFELYSISENEFITGSWEDFYLDNKKGFLRHLNGFLFIRKKDFMSVEGYNESFEGYGFDDCDLYKKLEKKGMIRKYLNHKFISIFHIPHEDYYRTNNYKCKDLKITLKNNRAISCGGESFGR